MSDDKKFTDVDIVITLRQYEDGRSAIFVAGPTQNKMLCAHMIADALKSIMDKKISPLTVAGGRS